MGYTFYFPFPPLPPLSSPSHHRPTPLHSSVAVVRLENCVRKKKSVVKRREELGKQNPYLLSP